jgi:hypothetical protein
MIKSIKHRGLRLLLEEGDRSKIRADLVAKAERFLDALDAAAKMKMSISLAIGCTD